MTDGREVDAELKRVLGRYAVSPASTALRARILASAPTPRVSWSAILREEIFGWAPALPALVIALALGIAAGLVIDTSEPDDLLQMAAFQHDLEEDE